MTAFSSAWKEYCAGGRRGSNWSSSHAPAGGGMRALGVMSWPRSRPRVPSGTAGAILRTRRGQRSGQALASYQEHLRDSRSRRRSRRRQNARQNGAAARRACSQARREFRLLEKLRQVRRAEWEAAVTASSKRSRPKRTWLDGRPGHAASRSARLRGLRPLSRGPDRAHTSALRPPGFHSVLQPALSGRGLRACIGHRHVAGSG